MSEKLLPCPLCGSDDLHVVAGQSWCVKCHGCYLKLQCQESRKQAIFKWNTRAQPNNPPAETLQSDVVERVAEAIALAGDKWRLEEKHTEALPDVQAKAAIAALPPVIEMSVGWAEKTIKNAVIDSGQLYIHGTARVAAKALAALCEGGKTIRVRENIQ